MATRIVWDEEPTAPEPKLEPKEEGWVPALTSPTMIPESVSRDALLATIGTDELIAELNRRMISTGMPTTIPPAQYVSYPPYAPTITITSGTYTVPATTITSTLSSVGTT